MQGCCPFLLDVFGGQIDLPKTICPDNGPEFISKTLSKWCKGKRVELQFIQPDKPMQDGYMERLNRFYREDVLDAYWFNHLHQIKALTQKWMEDYNTRHPHSSIGGNTRTVSGKNSSPKQTTLMIIL
ncbi:integrase core domain-containing protein [Flagellimonas sp.]|uniref:integrase core domain-containing protein n=1 Tax=Flagellimonas sp. TaxID=2058762 RepID=UPI003AB546B6